jgi:hypothetical protein
MKINPQELADTLAALKGVETNEDAGESSLHSRIYISVGVKVLDVASGQAYGALTRDISFASLSLIQSRVPAPGAELVIELPLNKNKQFRVRCKVGPIRELADGLFRVSCLFVEVCDVHNVPK